MRLRGAAAAGFAPLPWLAPQTVLDVPRIDLRDFSVYRRCHGKALTPVL